MRVQRHHHANTEQGGSSVSPVVTLLTDFGSSSGYVAQMELLLREAIPQVRVVHIAHDLRSHDVRTAAWLLYSVVRGLPAVSRFHLSVVDPGVGSGRRVLYVEALGQQFLAPDNGLLSHILDLDPGARVWQAPDPTPSALRTFHGRDHFVPLAVTTLQGKLDWELCDKAGTPRFLDVRLDPVEQENGYAACVLHADSFGNLITQLRAEHVFRGPAPSDWNRDLVPGQFAIGKQVLRVCTSYAEISENEIAVILGSSGHWELAMREASAEAALGSGVLVNFVFA